MKKRIVVVDDDPSIQDIFSIVFDDGQYEVDIYGHATNIMNLDFEIPDLFILDKQLSGASGLDVCRFLKLNATTQHIPVVIISATPGVKQLATEAGAQDALEKPFRLNDLRDTVYRLLEQN